MTAQIDLETLKNWRAACDPLEPISPKDGRWVDLNGEDAHGHSLRGEDLVLSLFDVIRLSGEKFSCQLFSGFPGTGKSTELRRLVDVLEKAGYIVLCADAQNFLDLSSPLNEEDLLIAVAGAFGEEAATKLGRDDPGESYWTRFRDFLQTEVQIPEVKLPAGPLDLKVVLQYQKPFWAKVREALARSPLKLRNHAQGYIQQRIAALRGQFGKDREVVFILDSLERLRPPAPKFQIVMQSLVRIFLDGKESLRLPGCHTIYTAPPFIQLSTPALVEIYENVRHILPAIRVLEKGSDTSPNRAGVAVLRDVVGRRIPLEQVFGERQDFLDDLILASAGHVRTLISLVRELLTRALRKGLPPEEAELKRIIQPLQERLRFAISENQARLLHRVMEAGTVEGLDSRDYGTLAQLLNNYVVLCYRNGDGAFEVHPLVRTLVRDLALRDPAQAAQ